MIFNIMQWFSAIFHNFQQKSAIFKRNHRFSSEFRYVSQNSAIFQEFPYFSQNSAIFRRILSLLAEFHDLSQISAIFRWIEGVRNLLIVLSIETLDFLIRNFLIQFWIVWFGLVFLGCPRAPWPPVAPERPECLKFKVFCWFRGVVATNPRPGPKFRCS